MLWEESLAREYERQAFTMATAESCTGGLVAHRITNVAGASRYFQAGLITYSNEAKIKLLGVEPALLAKHGAVSAEVALAMAVGVARLCGTELGVGVTGIAGPGGGSLTKPVGLVYWAVSFRGKTALEREIFRGDRETIKAEAADRVLGSVQAMLQGL